MLRNLMNTKVCGITLALLAAVAMVFSFAAAASFDAEEGDEDDPQPIDYLIGYVFNIPPQMEREPIAGVQVTVWYSMSQPYAHTFTKDDGYFEIKYDPSIQYISFNIDDFTSITIKCAPEEMTELKERFPDAIGEPYNGNKRHWISVKVNSEVNDTMLKQLVLNSYDLVKRPFSRKK